MNKDQLIIYAGLKKAVEIIDNWYTWIKWENAQRGRYPWER